MTLTLFSRSFYYFFTNPKLNIETAIALNHKERGVPMLCHIIRYGDCYCDFLSFHVMIPSFIEMTPQ